MFRAILPAEDAAVVLQALRAARNDLEHPHDQHDNVSAETRTEELSREDAANGISFSAGEPPESRMESAQNLADALVQLCADYLNAKAATAENPDTYQVIIHAGAQAISAEPGDAGRFRGNAEGAADTLPVSHPAHPMRCHIQDGLALSLSTLALISCNATISTMIHDTAGAISTSAAAPASPRPRSAAPSANATATAASSPAATPVARTLTTSSTGPTAGRPSSATSSACARDTTPLSTTRATS